MTTETIRHNPCDNHRGWGSTGCVFCNGNEKKLLDETLQQRAIIDRLEAEKSALLEELNDYRNGYKGACYACEPVGMANKRLEAENKKLREENIMLRQLCAAADNQGISWQFGQEPEEREWDKAWNALQGGE